MIPFPVYIIWTAMFRAFSLPSFYKRYAELSFVALENNDLTRMYGTIFIITNLLVLAHESLGLYRINQFNLTGLFKRNYDADSYRYNVPVLRDISYLPEEDYNVEHKINDEEFQELDRQNRNLMPEYQNLCEIVTRRVQFNDEKYEYQPPHYHEIYCKSYSRFDQGTERAARSSSKQKCAHPGFHCVQRSRMLFVVRRAWDSDCWEPFTKEIASGCDCMWPVSVLGDIGPHY